MTKFIKFTLALILCSVSLVHAEPTSTASAALEDLLPPYCTLNFDLTKDAAQNPKTSSLEDTFFSFRRVDENDDQGAHALRKPFETGAEFLLPQACSPLNHCSYTHWHLYKTNFGLEKVYMRFPYAPSISHGNTLLVAYAYEYNVLYSFTGYYPPVGSIDPAPFFDTALFNASQPPYALLSYAIYQIDCFSVLDYVMHDTYKDMMVRNRTIVTPFNAYTLQAVSPFGNSTRFDYFIDSFKVKTMP